MIKTKVEVKPKGLGIWIDMKTFLSVSAFLIGTYVFTAIQWLFVDVLHFLLTDKEMIAAYSQGKYFSMIVSMFSLITLVSLSIYAGWMWYRIANLFYVRNKEVIKDE